MLSATQSAILSGLWPPMATAVQYFLAWASYYQIPVRLGSGFRSLDEQAGLYAQGRTPEEIQNRVAKHGEGGSVTDAPPGYSAHNYGLAVDIETDQLAQAMALAKYIGFAEISWDPDHLEWPGWRQLVGI